MTKDEFVDALIKVVRNASINDAVSMLESPPGRRPKEVHTVNSNWYNGLTSEDREYVKSVITETVDSTVFGCLCVLDGVRVIENRPTRHNLVLKYIGEEPSNLNGGDGECLHDIYNDKIRSI